MRRAGRLSRAFRRRGPSQRWSWGYAACVVLVWLLAVVLALVAAGLDGMLL